MEEEINLIELFNIFWKKKVIIICVTLICGIIGAVYSINYKVPKYKTSTTLLLTQNNVSENSEISNEITQTDITLNQQLVSTYSALVKSKSILKEVLQNLQMEPDLEEELKENIQVKAVEDTQVIEITYINENAEISFKVASELSNVFCEKIKEIYNINNIYIVDKAEIATEPYNINHIKDILLFMIAGIGISCITIFIWSLFDTTVKKQEDVEENTGLIVLAQIPEIKVGGKK